VRPHLACLLAAFLALGADDEGAKPNLNPKLPTASARKPAPPPEFDPDRETEALAFIGRNHPDLATVLGALKPKDPAEYRKAVVELSQVARVLADQEARNPARYAINLDAWKARSRVELLAARLAASPDSAELRDQLRSAIGARVDVEVRRQRFDLQQAELAAKRARENLDRLENHRDSLVESRFRSLQPRKAKKAAAKPKTPTKPTDPSTQPPNPTAEDRR